MKFNLPVSQWMKMLKKKKLENWESSYHSHSVHCRGQTLSHYARELKKKQDSQKNDPNANL